MLQSTNHTPTMPIGGCPALARTLPKMSDTMRAANSACGSMHPRAPEDLTTVNTGNSITLTVTELHRHSARGATLHATDLSVLPAPATELRWGCSCSCGGGTAGTCGHPDSTVSTTEGVTLPGLADRPSLRRRRGAVTALPSRGLPTGMAPSRGAPTCVSQKLLASARKSWIRACRRLLGPAMPHSEGEAAHAVPCNAEL